MRPPGLHSLCFRESAGQTVIVLAALHCPAFKPFQTGVKSWWAVWSCCCGYDLVFNQASGQVLVRGTLLKDFRRLPIPWMDRYGSGLPRRLDFIKIDHVKFAQGWVLWHWQCSVVWIYNWTNNIKKTSFSLFNIISFLFVFVYHTIHHNIIPHFIKVRDHTDVALDIVVVATLCFNDYDDAPLTILLAHNQIDDLYVACMHGLIILLQFKTALDLNLPDCMAPYQSSSLTSSFSSANVCYID